MQEENKPLFGRKVSEMSLKLAEMQRFFRLTVTGTLNNETLEMMKQPRCGVPDVAAYRADSTANKWPTNKLTYRYMQRCYLSPFKLSVSNTRTESEPHHFYSTGSRVTHLTCPRLRWTTLSREHYKSGLASLL